MPEFVEALDTLPSPVLATPSTEGPMADRWRTRKAPRALAVGARDLCDVRGAAAHCTAIAGAATDHGARASPWGRNWSRILSSTGDVRCTPTNIVDAREMALASRSI